MSIYINPDIFKGDIRKEFYPTTGYCIMIDISDSTEMKGNNTIEWIISFYNTFIRSKISLKRYWPPLKIIGDELIFFITDDDIANENRRLLNILNCLIDITNEKDTLFKKVKISMVRCCNSYQITFKEGEEDVYGKDIDLCARLLSMAEKSEILMSEEMFDKISMEYGSLARPDKNGFYDVKKIFGPWPVRIKGFDNKMNIYKTSNRNINKDD